MALDGVHRLHVAPVVVGADTFGPVSILVTDPARSRPVVLVQDAAPLAEQLASELAGVAHTVVLTAAHGADLVSLLELGSLAPGDVVVLWPGWQLGDEWPTRDTWSRGALVADPEVAARPIVADVLAASVLHLATLDLVDALRDAMVRARVEALPAEDPAAAPPPADHLERAPGAPTLPQIDVASWEADLRALAEARQELDDLRAETRRLDIERDDLVALLSTRFEEEVARAVELRTGSGVHGPRSLGAAIEEAADLAHLVVLPAAIEQARAWPFLQPAKVLDHLRTLDALVGRWQQGVLRESLHAAILNAGLPWARDVSASAHRRFPQDYTVRWEGRSLLLGPHLRYGTGPPTRQCRIYCAVVADPRTLVIGHVGAHLRGHRDR
jgi:hypothetical protein